ncbi:hypothetical protein [Massilia sp. Leaf139]|uniref:hypothetical protein n=1 Tax=Massilia sp. Leaf139 TaxID=1736272 RepID=UPI000A56A054|nr:hypothetical protein [Massilia sp. Leaf139]
MNQSRQPADPAAKGGAILHEDDIGSGEKTPAEKETEEMIKEIPPLKGTNGSEGQQSGS